MKILKPGKIPVKALPQRGCPNCGCVFEYEERDVMKFNMYKRVDRGLFCPQDGCAVFIDFDKPYVAQTPPVKWG